MPLKNELAVRAALAKPFPLNNLGGLTYDAVFAQLENSHGLVVRFDVAAIARFYPAGMGGAETVREQFLVGGNPGSIKVNGLINPNGTTAELLTDLTACLPGRMTYRVRGNRVLITPAYIPASKTAEEAESDGTAAFARHYKTEQTLGPPVSVSFKDADIVQVVEELRALTGANIVLTANKDSRAQKVSATFDDVRLKSALEVIADMTGQGVVFLGNVYYIATEEAIQRMYEKSSSQNDDKLPAIPTPQPMG